MDRIRAFERHKQNLSEPPALVPPNLSRPFMLYIFASMDSVGTLLAPYNDEGHEKAAFYISRFLNAAECKVNGGDWDGDCRQIRRKIDFQNMLSDSEEIDCTDDSTEYEAFIRGTIFLLDLKVKSVRISGYPPLVLTQFAGGTSRCLNGMSARYLAMAQELPDRFDNVELEHKTRGVNVNANDLAQLASGYKSSYTFLQELGSIPPTIESVLEQVEIRTAINHVDSSTSKTDIRIETCNDVHV